MLAALDDGALFEDDPVGGRYLAADHAARAALDDLPTLQQGIARISAERDRLYAALSEFSQLSPYPSRANFVLCRVSGFDAAALSGIEKPCRKGPRYSDTARSSAPRPAT